MQTIAVVYFAYMFVSFYFLILTLLLYFKNKNSLLDAPAAAKNYSVSIIVPACNEEESIADTLKHIFELDYPNITDVLVVNDGSTDNTLEILKKLLPKYKPKLKILTKKNSGKADSINRAIRFCRGELIVVIDADSYPAADSLSKLAGFFDDAGVGAATAACVPRNRETFLEKLQAIEYKVIAFTRKLLGYVDSIYVTPGSLSIYRKTALKEIGGFDTKNLTEDIEATWHLLHNGWKIRMCMDSVVTTTVPNKISPWFRQRRRWAVGGLQCLNKYKAFFFRKGMFGYFVLPFFGLGLILGLVGAGIFAYLFLARMLRYYLYTKYSLAIGVPVIATSQFFITPSVLNYFGIVLFALFFMFTFFVLAIMKDNLLEKQSFFNLLFYMCIYLLIYPIVILAAIGHLIRRKRVW